MQATSAAAAVYRSFAYASGGPTVGWVRPASMVDPSTLPQPLFTVTNYAHCKADGVTDCTAGIQDAINAAQAAGKGTVWIPAGVYALTATCPVGAGCNQGSLMVYAGNGVTIAGAGRDYTRLVEHVYGQKLLAVRAQHTVVEDLTLDAQTVTAGTDAFTTSVSYVTLQHFRALGSPLHYAVHFDGPPGASQNAPLYNTGNVASDGIIVGEFHDSDLDFSFQDHATVSYIELTGARVGFYVSQNSSMSYVTVYKGVQDSLLMGWVCTQCSNITFSHFTSGPGIAGGRLQQARQGVSRVNLNITVTYETMQDSTTHLEIGDVTGLNVNHSSLGNIVFNPLITAEGSLSATSYGNHSCNPAPGATIQVSGFSC